MNSSPLLASATLAGDDDVEGWHYVDITPIEVDELDSLAVLMNGSQVHENTSLPYPTVLDSITITEMAMSVATESTPIMLGTTEPGVLGVPDITIEYDAEVPLAAAVFDGNVGINTDNLEGYALNVNGTLRVSGAVTLANYAGTNNLLYTSPSGEVRQMTASVGLECLQTDLYGNLVWGSCDKQTITVGDREPITIVCSFSRSPGDTIWRSHDLVGAEI